MRDSDKSNLGKSLKRINCNDRFLSEILLDTEKLKSFGGDHFDTVTNV